jgi:DNA-binding NtrC family response regulator
MNDKGPLVYVVDDDASAREGVARLIRSAGLTAKTFASGEEFLAAPRPKPPSCLVLDVNLPGVSGLDLQQELAKSNVQVPIIFLTGYGDIPMTVRAVKAGAVNFLTKPVDDEELLSVVRQSICSSLEEDKSESFEDIIGESEALQRVMEQIAIVARTGSTVLLEGETGTGKELLARAVHNLSQRKDGAFVRLNCAAIPSGLVESELFGHEKGAFTGALMQKRGRFELADRGTLFLDEIGDITLDLQPKLLRALQEREFERLGSARTIQVDVRLIAATHRDLVGMVRDGKFREDLFYRLNVFPIEVPPLRERHGDIALLIRFFTQKYAKKLNRVIDEIPPAALDALTKYHWPGNIRELQNLVERSVILSRGRVLNIAVSQESDGGASSAAANNAMRAPRGNSESRFDDAQRQAIMDALRASSGRIAGAGGAAERLGLKRTTLQNKMHKLGINRASA